MVQDTRQAMLDRVLAMKPVVQAYLIAGGYRKDQILRAHAAIDRLHDVLAHRIPVTAP